MNPAMFAYLFEHICRCYENSFVNIEYKYIKLLGQTIDGETG